MLNNYCSVLLQCIDPERYNYYLYEYLCINS